MPPQAFAVLGPSLPVSPKPVWCIFPPPLPLHPDTRLSSATTLVQCPLRQPPSTRHPPSERIRSGAMSPPPSLPRSNSDSTPPGEMTSLGMEAKRAPKTIFRIVAQSIIPLWYELPLKLERKPFSKSAIPHLTSPTSDSRHPPSECNKPLWCNVSPTLHSQSLTPRISSFL